MDYKSNPYVQAVLNIGQKRGYSPVAIAGVLGRAYAESNLRTDGPPGDNGRSYGAQQWNGGRLDALKALSNQMGKSWTDPMVQATHAFNELEGPESKAGGMLKGAKDIPSAIKAMEVYERPYGYNPSNLGFAAGSDMARVKAAEILKTIGSNTGGLVQPPAADDQPQEPQDAQMQAKADMPAEGATETAGGFNTGNFGGGLQGLGAALMARDKPDGARVLSGLANESSVRDAKNLAFEQRKALQMQRQQFMAQQSAERLAQQHESASSRQAATRDLGLSPSGTARHILMPDGTVKSIPIPQEEQAKPVQPKEDKVTAAMAENFTKGDIDIEANTHVLDVMRPIQQRVMAGLTVPSWDANAKAFVENTRGMSSQQAADIKDFTAALNAQVARVVASEKGPGTKIKFDSAMNAYAPLSAESDPAQFLQITNRIARDAGSLLKANARKNAGYLKRSPSLAGDLYDEDGNPKTHTDLIKDYSDRVNKFEKEQAEVEAKSAEFSKSHFAKSSGNTTAAEPTVNTVDEAMKLPPGTKFRGPDGKLRIR